MAFSEKKENNLVLDWIFKTLGILVVPIIGWGIKIQVEVSTLKEDMKSCNRLEDKIERVDNITRSNSTDIAGMREKFKNVAESIATLKNDINSIIYK